MIHVVFFNSIYFRMNFSILYCFYSGSMCRTCIDYSTIKATLRLLVKTSYLIVQNNSLFMHLKVALTTLCGIFMNLCVLEANLVSSDPVFKELLDFTITALPSIGELRDVRGT